MSWPFARRPGSPEAWIRAPEARKPVTARLTIDVTPELRGRIKIAAYRQGVTVADLLRDLLARHFPASDETGDVP
ncbi:putative HicB family RNase H-like nuclease [Inquilinus ginsengisoli]|uniref:chromosome partitioning protein ParB n=1 Tax=Inquilinus ginsengisoli TaxID=363840 RepID=UPI003D1CC139